MNRTECGVEFARIGQHPGGHGSLPDSEKRAAARSTHVDAHPASASRPRISIADWLLSRLSRETSSGRFIPEMDGLRFIAIGMVILFHVNGYLTVKSPLYHAAPPQSDWLAQAALVGFRGVELFFVISGFILGLPFAARYIKGARPVSLRKYYLRRLTRLEPPYFAAVLILFVLAIWISGKSETALYPHLWASLLYLHNLIFGSANPFIVVAWSLEIEVQFYLLVPLLTLLFSIRSLRLRRFSMIALVLAILLAQSLFLHDSPRASLSILAYLQFFLVGFLLADVFLASWDKAPRRNLAWDLVALAGWPLLFVILHSHILTHWLFPVWVFLLYCAAFRGRLINHFFSNRWITAIGGMCYSIYLLQYQVISAVGRLTRRLGETAPYWIYLSVQIVLVGAAIVVICGAYFVAIEKPCMRRDWPQRLWDYGQRNVFAKFRLTRTSTVE
jgi:peptidoglycan/LPS O-acetylase OafA/YrhL